MSEHRKTGPAQGGDPKARQKARLAEALRENLRRRKAQARERAAAAPDREKPHDSAGIGADKRDS
jgi:hypothetical protein